MAHGSSLFSGHFPDPVISGEPYTSPTPPVLPIRPRISGEDGGEDGFDTQTGKREDPPWADFGTWSNLGQQNQQQAIDQLEGEMKWGPPLGMASSLLIPFPFGAAGSAIGTGIGMSAAKDLYGIQHGPPTNMFSPQWSFLDALNPFSGPNPAEQLSRNIMNLESAWLASPASAPPGWSGPGWSGLGIPDDIQIDYGASRSERGIADLLNAWSTSDALGTAAGYYGAGPVGPDPDDAGMGSFSMSGDPDLSHADMWNTGGPVVKRRGSGEAATSPLAAGSFVDKPLYDRAVDTSPTYRRW